MAGSDDKVQTASSYAAILRRRWLILATIIPSVFLLAVFLAYSLPTTFRSTATILIEASSISSELVQSTVASYADQQLELVQRTVMTPDRLEQVVEEIDPYPGLQESNRVKARMIIGDTGLERVDPITLEVSITAPAFSVYYDNPNPEVARDITERIAGLFLAYNLQTRTGQARETHDFLLAKSRELTAQIREIEQGIAEFKSKYGDALPEARIRNEQAMERVQRDIDAADAQARLLDQQETMLSLQLAQTSPTIVSSATDVATQLGLLKSELAAAQQKYTPDHPDVRRLKRAIEGLAAQAKLGNSAQVVPDNPEYLRISAELNAVRSNLAALRSTAARGRTQLAEYERRLFSTPGVERDYVQLERDRQLTQEQLVGIRNKLQAAEVAQSLESESMGERYTLIREANMPHTPHSPNRPGMILLGFVLGGALAVGLAAFRETADPTVRSSSDVFELADLPLIGAIPKLLTQADRRRQRLLLGSLAGGYLVAIAVVTVTVIRGA